MTLPTEEQFARNLIGGRWEFPKVPFDYEVRSPLDGTVTAVVPLSSRFDVARAVAAAASAADSWARDDAGRVESLGRLVARIERHAEPLARLQAVETGLDLADSRAAIDATARFSTIAARAGPGRQTAGPGRQTAGPGTQASAEAKRHTGAAGCILSWGLPFTEVVCAVLPRLLAGHTAVIRPSLRAPLSAAAFAHLATTAGVPPGVVNLVQGTGIDAGAALARAPGLTALHVRAGERTLAQAARAAAVTGTPLATLRAGGNVALAGRDADPAPVAGAVLAALALHSAAGPLSLPLLCAHTSIADALTDAIRAGLDACRPVPLPAEPLRDRALAQLAALRAGGATVHAAAAPDDARHRMGWVLPPAMIIAGPLRGEAAEPIGPVLTVRTWRSPRELAGAFSQPRHADGVACVWGLGDAELDAAQLPHSVILRAAAPLTALSAGALPAAWTAGKELQ